MTSRTTKTLAPRGRQVLRGALLLNGAIALLLAGCKHTETTALTYGNAINTYYSAHPACLFANPIKLPVQVDAKNDASTSGYDALVDQGLLLRTTSEKREMLVLSKQVTNYDLNERGRSAWTADPAQPGYGNFCYGHRNVQTIDSSTSATAQSGATTQVTYHYTISSSPAWALAAETQNAYPELKANLSGSSSDSATLVDTNGSWIMQAPASRVPIHPADGKIAE